MAAARRPGVPHMGSQVDLEVAFGGERLSADAALERFVAGVSPHVDLEGAGAGERLPALLAHVTGNALTTRTHGARGGLPRRRRRRREVVELLAGGRGGGGFGCRSEFRTG